MRKRIKSLIPHAAVACENAHARAAISAQHSALTEQTNHAAQPPTSSIIPPSMKLATLASPHSGLPHFPISSFKHQR
jgi:hypothetical protein